MLHLWYGSDVSLISQIVWKEKFVVMSVKYPSVFLVLLLRLTPSKQVFTTLEVSRK